MTNICNKNDFIIKLRLSDKDGVVLPYTQFNWDIRFYTTKNKPFRTYCNNGVINDGTTIVGEYLYITVNGFDWELSGSVYLKIFTTFANTLYVDGTETFSNNPYLITSFAITDGFSIVDIADENDDMVIVANVVIEEDLVIPFRVGIDGADGRGILSITKTNTIGLIDTYTITYNDATTSTFSITNGTNGIDGTNGREVEFQKSITHIQWRYVGDVTWTNLVALTDITGEQGIKGDKGDSAYQSYLDTTSDDPPLTEEAWADLRLANIDGGTFN